MNCTFRTFLPQFYYVSWAFSASRIRYFVSSCCVFLFLLMMWMLSPCCNITSASTVYPFRSAPVPIQCVCYDLQSSCGCRLFFFSLRCIYLMILTSFSLSSFSFGVCLFNKTAASKSAPKSKEENTFSISKHTLSISISNACLNLTCVYHYPWNTVVVAHRKEKPLHREKKQSKLNHYSFLDRFFLSDLLHNFVDTVEFKSLSTFSLLVLVDWFDCH